MNNINRFFLICFWMIILFLVYSAKLATVPAAYALNSINDYLTDLINRIIQIKA